MNNQTELTKSAQLLFDHGIITDFQFKRALHKINVADGGYRFQPPSVTEVREYFGELFQELESTKEIRLQISEAQAERFMDYYETNNWNCGRKKMSNWKYAVRNWIRNYKENGQSKKSSTYNQSVGSTKKGETTGVPSGASSGGSNVGAVLQGRLKQV